MAEVAYMEHEIEKRKTNPNASDADYIPDPKKIYHVAEEEPRKKLLPHEFKYQSVLEYLFKAKCVRDVAHKVMENTKLELLICDLKKDLYDPCSLGKFACRVHNELFNSEDFIQAFFYAYDKKDTNNAYDLIMIMESYKNENQPHERMKFLNDDPFLNNVLRQKKSLNILRGILSASLGYCFDDAFHNKLKSIIRENNRRKNPPSRRCPFSRNDIVVGIDSPATVEGLKDALRCLYPANEVKFMCEEIDRMSFKYRCMFANCKESDQIKAFKLNMSDGPHGCFSIALIWFSYDSWVLHKFIQNPTISGSTIVKGELFKEEMFIKSPSAE